MPGNGLCGSLTTASLLSRTDWKAAVTDRMHAVLVTRADELMGCTEGSPEEAELETLADAIEAYEAVQWPEGKIPGGKG